MQTLSAKQDLGQLFQLNGRKAVVVGAGGGIGLTLARGFAAHGAQVVCVDRTEEIAQSAVEAITQDGKQSSAEACDMLNTEAIEDLAERHSDAEVLVIMPAVMVRKKLMDQSESEIDFQLAMNVKYTLLLARAFGANMAKRGKGSIIAFSSIRAFVVEPASGMYSATKAAVVAVMKSLAVELGPQGVRVNTVAPSPVATPLTADVRSKQEWVDIVTQRSMLRRWATAEDFVGPVLLLASDAGGFVTGATLMVDGGWTATDGLARTED
ncbi:3-oxoacyl-ACP reductase [Arthrobacter sp. MYb229]|uniref:SDR family NAD(P)-dependent oxidoreductase n=1 Tax=unclassified Arthrobacter TaxID=235627 RepID=UPI000CFCBEF3|nr:MULTISPECIES: SDR family oxidoreductase [unclassified Arthrobacter]PRA06913.1 3-oxoacyl-ACP reductase [Arthrobacter sp. MYb229]PRB47861.1 3-oxoacyl-ACP reductase [Arthrobacter sp. MYb216]